MSDGSGKTGVPLAIKADVEHIIALAKPLEAIANASGIFNVFDDGGYRTLIVVTMFGLKKPLGPLREPLGRLGDDATDNDGNSYELKTINLINTKGEIRKTYPGVTTEHTLRLKNVQRYRKTCKWLIGIFHGNVPLEIWELDSAVLEPFYTSWEQRIRASGGSEINNPKIPFAFVAQHGVKHVVKGALHIARPAPGRRFRLPGQ